MTAKVAKPPEAVMARKRRKNPPSVGIKTRELIREGDKPEQAYAIAMNMKRRGRLTPKGGHRGGRRGKRITRGGKRVTLRGSAFRRYMRGGRK